MNCVYLHIYLHKFWIKKFFFGSLWTLAGRASVCAYSDGNVQSLAGYPEDGCIQCNFALTVYEKADHFALASKILEQFRVIR